MPPLPPNKQAQDSPCSTNYKISQVLRRFSACLSSTSKISSLSSLLKDECTNLSSLLEQVSDALSGAISGDLPDTNVVNASRDRTFSEAHNLNTFLNIDILHALVCIVKNTGTFITSIAERASWAQDHSSSHINRDDHGLEGLLYHAKREYGCLDFVYSVFRNRKTQSSMMMEDVDANWDAKELARICADSLVVLDRILLSFNKALQQSRSHLFDAVHQLRSIFIADNLPSNVSLHLIRETLCSFMHFNETESPGHGINGMMKGGFLEKRTGQLVSRLMDQRGPAIIGVCGNSGVGKTCLVSQVCSDHHVMANFPGGIYRLSLGPEPDLISLQELLWKQMRGSKINFKSLQEGGESLMGWLSESLPCLLILDDVYDSSHIRAFTCFDGYDKVRVFVISHSREVVENIPCPHIEAMAPLDEQEAWTLFVGLVGCTKQVNAENETTFRALVRRCGGIPQLIQATASIVYFMGDRTLGISSIIHLLHEDQYDVYEQSAEGCPASVWLLLPYYHVLSRIHPCLQDCFLDLAAFPKGNWVCLARLEDIWGVGGGMENERIMLMLSLLVSMCFIEWRVEKDANGLKCHSNGEVCLQWRLSGRFYDLAKALNEKRLEQPSCIDDGKDVTVFSSVDTVNRVDDFNSAEILSALHDILEVFDAQSELCCNTINVGIALHWTERNSRLFLPGCDVFPIQWIERGLSEKATKLSLVCGSFAKVPYGVNLSSLRIALLTGNTRLESISPSVLKCMEQLVVLDLKQCTKIAQLPDSITKLHSLELLDLSSCVHLVSLPHSIGKLQSLRFLRLSGCLSLTYLPKTIGRLSNLVMLDLSSCVRLTSLPQTIGHLSSLQNLNLRGCYLLHYLPNSIVHLTKLKVLNVSGCSNLPHSLSWLEQVKYLVGLQDDGSMTICSNLWKLGHLEMLHLCALKNLTRLPGSIGKLQHLHHLSLSSCRTLEHLPSDLACLNLLQKLDLSYTAVRKLPDALGLLKNLVALCLRGCCRLLCIPSTICKLPKLEVLDMAECWDFVLIPKMIGYANSLPSVLELDLSGCSIKQLPPISVGGLGKLQKLHLSGCQNLTSLPETLWALSSLEKMDLEGCKSLASLHGVGLGKLEKLSWLSLRNCLALKSLPVSELVGLSTLKFLDVSGCSGLDPFPQPLLFCAREQRLTLVRWGTVWH